MRDRGKLGDGGARGGDVAHVRVKRATRGANARRAGIASMPARRSGRQSGYCSTMTRKRDGPQNFAGSAIFRLPTKDSLSRPSTDA